MPTRDRLTAAVSSHNLNGVTYLQSVNRMNGTKQSISALNNVGMWVPGQFRANPVVLEKWSCLSVPAFSTGEDKYLTNKGKIEGDLAAFIAAAANRSPLNSNWPSFYTAWDSAAAGQSLQKAYAAMNEAELDLGVALGELSETINGLVNPFSALKKWTKLANKLMKRGSRPKMSDNLDMLTGSWLEWRYGIQPTISFIQDIIEHIQAQSRALMNQMLRKRGSVKFTKTYNDIVGSTTVGSSYYLAGKGTVEVEHKYVSKVFYKYTRPLSWQERYGLDASALPSVAFELMKLSFVWDWFFSVGQWLKSLQVSDARTVLGCVTSQKSTATMVVDLTSCSYYGMVPAKISGSSYQLVYEKLDRRVNVPLPVSPVVNRAALNLKKQIDSVSLIWQQMPKLRR